MMGKCALSPPDAKNSCGEGRRCEMVNRCKPVGPALGKMAPPAGMKGAVKHITGPCPLMWVWR
jgi:hypothetical protein